LEEPVGRAADVAVEADRPAAAGYLMFEVEISTMIMPAKSEGEV